MVAEAKPSAITNVPPSYYIRTSKEGSGWLDSKRQDDNVEGGLWRINDTLYDLTDFIDKHPGGAEWLKMTKGHDITEAFMTHHLNTEKLQPLLQKYRVKETTMPRNVKLTFKEDGFYMTLRRRVAAKLPEIKINKKIHSESYVDGLFVCTLITAILTQRYQSIPMAILTSLFMTWTGICGHNYLHRRDNFRMYYINLIFHSFRDWRIGHVLSHHLFPNSLLDMELYAFEPFLVWDIAPSAKNWFQRYMAYVYSPFFYCFLFIFEFTRKMYYTILHGHKIHFDEFFPFVIPLAMYLFGGDQTLASALKLYLITVMSGGFFYGFIGLNAGHHHPSVVTDGDAVRGDFDWGLYTLDTIIDRQELRGNALLALTHFGDHALHHLFPTLDHGILPELYDIFFQTLLEFEAECQCYPWFFDCIKGQFQQLSRIEPTLIDPRQKYLLKMQKKDQVVDEKRVKGE